MSVDRLVVGARHVVCQNFRGPHSNRFAAAAAAGRRHLSAAIETTRPRKTRDDRLAATIVLQISLSLGARQRTTTEHQRHGPESARKRRDWQLVDRLAQSIIDHSSYSFCLRLFSLLFIECIDLLAASAAAVLWSPLAVAPKPQAAPVLSLKRASRLCPSSS